MNYTKAQYKEAFKIACELLNGNTIYGIDADGLFPHLMDMYDGVCSLEYQKFILENLDRFSDDEEVKHKAIERLGW